MASDVIKIRGLFAAFVDDVLNTLPRTSALNNQIATTIMFDLADRVDDLSRSFMAIFRGGLTAQQELIEKISGRFGDRFLPYGRQVPLVGVRPELLQIADNLGTSLIRGAGDNALRAINRVLRLSILGVGPGAHTAAVQINRALTGANNWSLRGESIYRTETLRASSVMADITVRELNKIVPTGKQWVWSQISRKEHAQISGQIRPINGFFDVPLREGGMVKMQWPRDPTAPASAVINCGCYHIPVPVGESREGVAA
jgi:hypothetical protein